MLLCRIPSFGFGLVFFFPVLLLFVVSIHFAMLIMFLLMLHHAAVFMLLVVFFAYCFGFATVGLIFDCCDFYFCINVKKFLSHIIHSQITTLTLCCGQLEVLLVYQLVYQLYKLHYWYTHWYTHQIMHARWGTSLSAPFLVTYGVRQGGILSPVLFKLCVDDLSRQLNQCRTGCIVGDRLVNHLVYADDLVVMSPSSVRLQQLLRICTSYCMQYDIIFNPTSSVIIIVRTKEGKNSQFPNLAWRCE